MLALVVPSVLALARRQTCQRVKRRGRRPPKCPARRVPELAKIEHRELVERTEMFVSEASHAA